MVAVVYAFLTLDHFIFGPFLLSRPLVMGSVVGFLCGFPLDGVVLGLLCECVFVAVPPAGPFQWDMGLAVALAGSWAFSPLFGEPIPRWALVLALLISIPLALLARRMDVWLRRTMRPLAQRALQGFEHGLLGPFRSSLLFSAVIWFLKSLVIFFAAESLGGALFRLVSEKYGQSLVLEGVSRAWVGWSALASASVLFFLSKRFEKKWFSRWN